MPQPGPTDLSLPAAETRPRWWRRVSLRRQVAYGFALPVLVVLLASLYLGNALQAMRDAANASVESTGAISLRYALLNTVIDAETGLRGYLLTSDEDFLAPYLAAPKNIAGVGRQLEITDAPEPAHIRKLRTVQALFGQWRDGYAEPLLDLRRRAPVGMARDLELLAGSGVPSPADDVSAARARIERRLQVMPAVARTATLRAAMQANAGRDPDAAQRARLRQLADAYHADEMRIATLIGSRSGKRIVDRIRQLMTASFVDELSEQHGDVAAAIQLNTRARWIAQLVPPAALVIGLSLVLLLLLDAIRAIDATTKAAAAVAAGNLDKRVRVLRRDELGALGQAFNRMAAELADRRRRGAALDRFQSLLASSHSLQELYDLVPPLCDALFPGTSGAIYRIAASRNVADQVARWNWPDTDASQLLDPDACRALRMGQPYFVGAGSLEVHCRHTEDVGVPVGRSACLPLMAQGEMLGILQLCRFGEPRAAVQDSARATAVLISEQLAMAMANLQLREQLRQQSIRDPLTGLYNRRYLEATMERELARCARSGQPLAVAAIDVDHFKRFNDTHGHEAGDHVLAELARVFREHVRATDIACRYGGEEFVLLLPDTSAELACERAGQLCAQVRGLRLQFGQGGREPVTISIGVACAPGDGVRADALLRCADSALYAAKAAGRDRVVRFEGS